MTKVSSRDLLGLLRVYKLADSNNVPKNIENITYNHPRSYSTLVSFKFLKNQFYLLFDEEVSDEAKDIQKEIQIIANEVKGQLLENTLDNRKTYAMPFKGKSCYLFQELSTYSRLDSNLAKKYPEYSRSTWQKYIKLGYVSVNGQVVMSPKYDTSSNDEIAATIPADPDHKDKHLPIIYIDDNVIVIDKPTGTLTHAKGAISDEFTVADFFKRYSTYNGDTNRCGIVHRLDRDTSGIMIGARNEETAKLLQSQFADRKVKKTYIAVVCGIPKIDKAVIDIPIGRNPSVPSTFRPDPNGKSAQTNYAIQETNGNLTLVKLEPKTGRTHQLRVHMKYINCPILGDKVYGKDIKTRLYLHASSLEVTIPNGKRMAFASPTPDDFYQVVRDSK